MTFNKGLRLNLNYSLLKRETNANDIIVKRNRQIQAKCHKLENENEI